MLLKEKRFRSVYDWAVSACLKKAWRNEKLAMLTAKIENRPTEQPKATEYRPELLIVPADYYGNSRTYYGD